MLLLNLSHHLPSFVRCVVNADTSPTWVRRAAPVSAGDPPNGRLSCGLRKEQAVEDVTEVVGLLGIRGPLWPALKPSFEYFVWDSVVRVTFQSVYPGVADTI